MQLILDQKNVRGSGKTAFLVNVVQKDKNTQPMRNGQGELSQVFSRTWNLLKMTLSFDLLEQEYKYQIEIATWTPPFVTDARMLKSLVRNIIGTKELSLKLAEFQTNLIGRLSKLRVYQGELGSFRDHSPYSLTESIKPSAYLCELGIFSRHWEINSKNLT